MFEFIMALSLTSPAFIHNGAIPKLYTCQGRDISPALSWSGLPNGTKSIALIVDDPDAPDPAAPKRVWVHWVLYNIPPSATGLVEAVGRTKLPPARTMARTTGTASATAVPARRSGGIATSTSFMRSTSSCRTCTSRSRRPCSRPWKTTCWKKRS